MDTEIDFLFDRYCIATPFSERCLKTWELFVARETGLGSPLTFYKHNNAALQGLYTLAKQDLAKQKQRAETLQVRQSVF
jgi:hypothetical protein